MALKPASTVVPATDAYTYTVVQIEAKKDGLGQDAPQKTDREGTPQWTVDALRSGPEGADLISVTVSAAQQPTVSGPAEFTGLRAGLWLGDKPRQGGIFWQADSVAAPSSSRRSSE